jgi:hypothetical protein
MMDFCFEALQSEPNLWRLMNSKDPEDTTVYALLMTYVDDIMVASSPTCSTSSRKSFNQRGALHSLRWSVKPQCVFLELRFPSTGAINHNVMYGW